MREKIELLTQQLVQQESTLGKSINAANVLYEFLTEYGLDPVIDEYKEGDANVYASIGDTSNPTILVSGHLDTVPLGDPDKWTHDPLSGKIINGELWGRGSVDMKGGVSSLAGVMVGLLDHEDDLNHRVLFAATAEEETGLNGAKKYVDKGLIDNISHILITEPTDIMPKTMEKGIMWLKINARGVQAHGSRPELGINAIEGISNLLPELYNVLPDLETKDLGKTSLNVGMIEGGTAPNVVPESCSVLIDIRTTPGVRNDEVINNISNLIEKYQTDVTYDMEIIENTPPVLTPSDDFAISLGKNTKELTGQPFELGGVHYATDGAIFMSAVDNSVPFAIYGPGSTELLHQTDERLDLKQLDISRRVIEKTILQINQLENI